MSEFLDVLRTEKKYTVSPLTAGQITARLSYLLPLDGNCENAKPYIVKSLYFDSLYNRDYMEKGSGLEFRKKIRLRSYGDGGIVKLEWKRKQGSKQRKQSLLLSKTDAEKLIRGDYRCLLDYDGDLPKQFYAMMTEEVYRPKCIVKYSRLAFTVPTNDIRITLEVKYNHFLLDYIRTALSSFELTETASSKYTASRYFGLGGTMS